MDIEQLEFLQYDGNWFALISPIGYAMIGKLALASLQGLMMGCWMMVTSVVSVLAGYVSGAMPQNISSTPLATNPGYSSVFNMLG
ncbi:hypothetical protein [Aeromonas caviae]|uniref:hypothetical protein n=1 Tax=Aeromonas caviae TaxID=648 RepID=UPI00249B7C38|nr:hypothetical protein [Aeromonas caviae]WGY75897.1 hypothetical protein MLL77_02155 [Aeromonas caviae]